jgi:hypothetical protein
VRALLTVAAATLRHSQHVLYLVTVLAATTFEVWSVLTALPYFSMSTTYLHTALAGVALWAAFCAVLAQARDNASGDVESHALLLAMPLIVGTSVAAVRGRLHAAASIPARELTSVFAMSPLSPSPIRLTAAVLTHCAAMSGSLALHSLHPPLRGSASSRAALR